MNASNHMVTLANGTQVSWEEFSNWSPKKQNNAINPPAKVNRMSLEKCIEISKRQRIFFSKGDPRPRRTGSVNKSSKSVTTPTGVFESIKATARAYGVTVEQVRKWIKKDKPKEFYFSNASHYSEKCLKIPRAVLTPQGRFPSMASAALHFGVDYQTIKAWINGTGRHAGEFHFVESLPTDVKCKKPKRL